jgi:hypothetical protein
MVWDISSAFACGLLGEVLVAHLSFYLGEDAVLVISVRVLV